MRVTFSPALESLIWAHAVAIREPKRQAGVHSGLVHTAFDGPERHRIHLSSEYAAARVLGVPMNATAYLHGDHGHDLELRGGRTVEVKSTMHPNGRFALLHDTTSFGADVGVLVRLIDHGADVVGWTTREDFDAFAQVQTLNRGPQRVLPNHRLRPIETLIAQVLEAAS